MSLDPSLDQSLDPLLLAPAHVLLDRLGRFEVTAVELTEAALGPHRGARPPPQRGGDAGRGRRPRRGPPERRPTRRGPRRPAGGPAVTIKDAFAVAGPARHRRGAGAVGLRAGARRGGGGAAARRRRGDPRQDQRAALFRRLRRRQPDLRPHLEPLESRPLARRLLRRRGGGGGVRLQRVRAGLRPRRLDPLAGARLRHLRAEDQLRHRAAPWHRAAGLPPPARARPVGDRPPRPLGPRPGAGAGRAGAAGRAPRRLPARPARAAPADGPGPAHRAVGRRRLRPGRIGGGARRLGGRRSAGGGRRQYQSRPAGGVAGRVLRDLRDPQRRPVHRRGAGASQAAPGGAGRPVRAGRHLPPGPAGARRRPALSATGCC